jgi:ATP-binding cassette subfamily B protein
MKKALPKEKKSAGPLQVIFFYMKQLRREWPLFTVVMLSTVSLQVANLIAPLYLRQFFNIISSSGPSAATEHQLVVTILSIGGIGLLVWFLRRALSLSTIYIEARAMSTLYVDAFDYLIKHSYQFFISQFAGTLTRRISKYAGSFETLFDSFASSFVPTILYVIGAVSILFARNHSLGLLLGAWAILFAIFQVYVSRLRQPIRTMRAEEDSALAGTFADAISNQNTIAIFSGASHEHENTVKAVGRWRAITLRSWVADDYIWGAQGFLMVLINVSLLYGAFRFWERGELTVGDFVLIQSYLLGIFDNLNSITRELRRVYDGFADAGEMVHIMQTPHSVKDRDGAQELDVLEGKINVTGVHFQFNEARPILNNLTLSIVGGEKVALVGPSGAGKSTITKLLLRLYDVGSGSIEIDGQDIARVTQESLRNAIAFVPQEPILFHRSLLENIRYGRRDATDEEVIEAAKLAHCHEFISELPEAYGTFVGERGVRLSGGERQRIAIARAILKNAPILLLDEATSSLDSQSEKYIQDSLEVLMEGKTVIVIAHRLSTIMKMDRIIVLEHGMVEADGTHMELIASDGLYRKLWNIQAGGFLSDE